jgi:hypothetical protein
LGFEKIGLKDYYAILKKAIGKFSKEPSLERDERERQFDQSEPDFENLDNEFYTLDKKNPLQNKLAEFIKRNKKDFYFKGTVSRPLLPS